MPLKTAKYNKTYERSKQIVTIGTSPPGSLIESLLCSMTLLKKYGSNIASAVESSSNYVATYQGSGVLKE